METMNLLQSFGVDQTGRLVSVEEVARGKACECCCPACGEMLIARQGDVRAWHFAHASGKECGAGAEGALHQAAKQLIVSEASILVPALQVRESHELDEGRSGEAALTRPAELWRLCDLREEVAIGDYRIDVVGTHDARPVFIEVAVTHLVDGRKCEALSSFGIHCFEVLLDPSMHDTWAWGTLRQEALERPDNRQWLFHPDLEKPRDQARCEAAARTLDQPACKTASVERIRFRLHGVPIHVNDRGWGVCLWSAYSERVNAIVKAIAKSLGGRYRKQYRNWVFSVGVKTILIQHLEGIGAVREES